MLKIILICLFSVILQIISCSSEDGVIYVHPKEVNKQEQVKQIKQKFEPSTVLFLGDSLTEGKGIPPEYRYTSLLQKKFDLDKIHIRILNAGISGAKTGDFNLSPWRTALKKITPSIKYFFICLGANDLFADELEQAEKNLRSLVDFARQEGYVVFLASVGFPYKESKNLTYLQTIGTKFVHRNYHSAIQRLDDIYERLGQLENVHLFPDLLKSLPEGAIGFDRDYMVDSDFLHPNEKGHELIADDLYPLLKELIYDKKLR